MTKMRTFATVLLFGLFSTAAFGQEVLMTIAGNDITVDEFERIYRKNNNSIHTNQQTPEEYLELFINFKLKVAEAENLGMDTTASFINEFEGYKEQLAKPYMTDDQTRKELMQEAYERSQYDIHASHILLNLPKSPSPEDTLAIYEKAMEIRQRILDGEDFESVARATSDDPSAKTNGGDLGFFTVFQMIYKFETVAYQMKPGEISMPFKTRYGYHILKLHEKRPALGKVKVAHIFVRTPEGMSPEDQNTAERKINIIFDSIQGGSDFGDIARKMSEDSRSAPGGGVLPIFGIGRMIPEFEEIAFNLENPGDVSQPVRSFYGWHLLKLIEKQPIGTYEEMESELQTNALKGERDDIKRLRYLEKLKKDHNYKLNEENYRHIYSLFDTSVFLKDWEPDIPETEFKKELITLKDGNATTGDFLNYIIKKHRRTTPIAISVFVDTKFSEFLEPFLMDLEMETLPDRHPEYKHILQEYHDGILLFELMDQRVWTHAVEDTLGLEKFYREHKNNYMWGERTAAIIVSADSTVDMESLMKKSSKIASGKWDAEKLNKKFCSNDTIPCISLKDMIVEKGENTQIDALKGKKGSTGKVYSENGKSNFVVVTDKRSPEPKKLNETRGQVTSDYQDYLEKLWISELRKKYEVSVNYDLLSKIKQ